MACTKAAVSQWQDMAQSDTSRIRAFDDKADVGNLQFVASKQTFNFDDVDQETQEGQAHWRACTTGSRFGSQPDLGSMESMIATFFVATSMTT